MTDKTLIIILLIWLGSNIILPLLIRSLDRLYKEKIDNIVYKALAGASYAFNRIGQILFIVLLLPALGISSILLSFKNNKIQQFLIEVKLNKLPQILFDKKFTIINLMRYMFISSEVESPK